MKKTNTPTLIPTQTNSAVGELEQIEEMENDLRECHAEFYANADIYTDYNETAKGMIAKGYRKQSEGEWRYNPDGMDWGLGAWECSVCRCRNDNLPMDQNINPMRWAGSKFCPNCGAKMKGV